ncbi:MAG: type II secretion system protein [Planctomycetota bacterium]|jgi:prepilin-type N-terminal cleavage/methylation domain-containing protein
MVTNRTAGKGRQRRSGFSLLELLAVVTILGIIAVVVIPRISVSADTAKQNAHKQNIAEINAAVERWYFEKGSYPKSDLSDIAADANYFPDGLPKNPLTDAAYKLNNKNRAE